MAGAKGNKAPRKKRKNKTKATTITPPTSPTDTKADLFLKSKPTPKDALRWLNLTAPKSADIKRAFRSLALIAHPDTGGSVIQMQALNAAKQILSRWT
jgi:hypothetical protein